MVVSKLLREISWPELTDALILSALMAPFGFAKGKL
jgi:hypothetical protein